MSQVVILTFDAMDYRQVRYLGPYQISWWIRENGYSVQVLDFLYFMPKENRTSLFKKYITSETKIVGLAPFSINYPTIEYYLRVKAEINNIINEVKEIAPWIKIVTGGVFSTKVHIYVDDPSKINAVVKGEGEHAFLDYCNHVFKNAPHPPFRMENNFKIIESTRTYDIQSCRMQFFENDFILPDESLPMELSRGCIFKCKFCAFPNIGKKKNDFNKSMESVKHTLLKNYELFGTTKYHMSDDTFNSHRQRIIDFHRMTQELPFKLEYIGYVKLDLIDIWPEQLELLPESGLISCHFGIETLDPDACRIIGKGWGANNYKPWLQKIRNEWKDEVIVKCSMIAGLGKETPKHWEDTVQWFKDIKLHDWVYAPLAISKTSKTSIIEKEFEAYGYKSTGEPTNSYAGPYKRWTNDVTSFLEAAEWCKNELETNKNIKKLSVWGMACYRNLGYTRQEIANGSHQSLHLRKVNENRVAAMIDKYYQAAISY